MPIAKKLLNYLDHAKVKYEVVDHKKVYTALDSAETQRLKPKQVVKTLVMKVDGDYMLALLPASRNLDKGKFKKTVNNYLKDLKKQFPEVKLAKKIDFAKEAWMKKNLVGKVGATPPFGKMLKVNMFMDSLLFPEKSLILNSGEYTQSLEMKTKDFLKLEEPFKGSFSQAKK